MTVLSSSTEVNMEEKSTIVFDFSLFRNYRSAHAVMRAALGSTDYIGNNLDALHDVLTSLRKETAIRAVQINRGREQIGSYCDRILVCIADAVRENPHLSLSVEESGDFPLSFS